MKRFPPKNKIFREFQEAKLADRHIDYLKANKEKLEKQDIDVINLINAYMNDDWPQRRQRDTAN